MGKPAIISTADGSDTLRHAVLGELYRSDRGAVGEAEYVFIGAGLEFFVKRSKVTGVRETIKIFEMGFGSGLNVWLTFSKTLEIPEISIDYHAVEAYPVPIETAISLNYTDSEIFRRIHECPWGMKQEINENFSLTKYNTAVESFGFSRFYANFDLIYFDAFSPEVQPKLWNGEIMENMFRITSPGGVLVTYSAKGSVKRALREAGFSVERLPGALGKRHMTRAIRPDNDKK